MGMWKGGRLEERPRMRELAYLGTWLLVIQPGDWSIRESCQDKEYGLFCKDNCGKVLN